VRFTTADTATTATATATAAATATATAAAATPLYLFVTITVVSHWSACHVFCIPGGACVHGYASFAGFVLFLLVKSIVL
jgi:hypothetical protein